MPKVKVVILNWNGREHLRTFLPSVLRDTPAEVGIVVADNGSTDGSVAMLGAEFPRVEVLGLDGNYGYAGGYNRALARIDADYCILLNSDVETAPGWCEPLVQALEADATLAAVQPKIRSYRQRDFFEYAGACGGFLDALGYPFCRGRILFTTERDTGQYDTFRFCFWASGACMACRREAFLAVGGFDEGFFAHMEEIDWCWRAQLYGYRIAVEPASTVYHLGGGTLANDAPRKLYLNYRNNLRMLYKNLPTGHLWSVLPLRMAMDGLSALVYLFQGRIAAFGQVWRAHMDFYRHLKTLRIARRNVQAGAIAVPYGMYRKSIVLRYYMGHREFGDMM